MRTCYVSEHCRNHADSEYASYVGVNRKGAKFIGNKHTNTLLHILEQICNDVVYVVMNFYYTAR